MGHADYFQTIVGSETPPEARDALAALEAIEALDGRAVVLLPDFHQSWNDQPKIVRKLRNLAHALKYTHKTLVVISPARKLPEELEDDAALLDYPSPDVPALKKILAGLLSAPGTRVDLFARGRGKARSLGAGSVLNQAQRVFAKAIVSGGVLDKEDIALIGREKRQIVRGVGRPRRARGAGEHWRRRRPRGPQAVAAAPGERLQRGSSRRTASPSPRGSRSSESRERENRSLRRWWPASWQLPLVRLDLGALYGRFVGESEENSRRALRLAETIAPCVLWIDELEKGISTGDNDGGTSLAGPRDSAHRGCRRRRSRCSWSLPRTTSRGTPQLLRRGRFDEVFFLDLPDEERACRDLRRPPRETEAQARRASTWRSSRRPPRATWARRLSRRSSTRCIVRSTIPACRREFTTRTSSKPSWRLIPLSRSQKENIGFLREWLHEGRAQSASLPEHP